MKRILWYMLSALVAVVLVTAAYQNNTSSRGSSAGAYNQPGSSGDASRYKNLNLH